MWRKDRKPEPERNIGEGERLRSDEGRGEEKL